MRAIEREWLVASIAAEDLGERLRADPSALAGERLRNADYLNFRDNLDLTYLVRLFAEFGAGLREAWEFAFRRTTVPNARDLIDSLYAQCPISDDWRDCAHNIRIYRNVLVHGGGGDAQPIGLRKACSDLCRFFSGLPHHW